MCRIAASENIPEPVREYTSTRPESFVPMSNPLLLLFHMLSALLVVALVAALNVPSHGLAKRDHEYRITILHSNDVHSHLQEFGVSGLQCTEAEKEENKCYGGVARMMHKIKEIRAISPNLVLLDAGDQMQGNLLDHATIARFMNSMKYDVMALGNHEFDQGQESLAKLVSELNFPVVSANMDLSRSNLLKDTAIKPYFIIERYGLAILGLLTSESRHRLIIGTSDIDFLDPVVTAQVYIDELHAMGIKRIVALTHNGYEEDTLIAKGTHGINLIVGGHSHTLVPTTAIQCEVVGHESERSYIVQAHQFGDHLGHVELTYSDNDELISIGGSSILLDQTVQEDSELKELVRETQQILDKANSGKRIIANALNDFPPCEKKSAVCAMAVLIGECLLEEDNDTTFETVAFMNNGGVRASFRKGSITVGSVFTVLPFGNKVARYIATGQDIWDTIEGSIRGRNVLTNEVIGSNPQWAGLTYEFDETLSPMLQSVWIEDKRLELSQEYAVLTSAPMIEGVDNILSTKPLQFELGNNMADTIVECLYRRKVIEYTENSI